MTKHFKVALMIALGSMAIGTTARAQEKPAAPAAAAKATDSAPKIETPLKLQIMILRYQGEKKVSSMPHTLSVNARPAEQVGVATLRMGSKIPVATTVIPVPKVDGKEMKDFPTMSGPISYSYHDVGTNIDCRASSLPDGRFRIELTVDDSSVYPEEQGKGAVAPSFRTFRAQDSMLLRDGQTAQFTAATDKINGEITRVEVTLTVVK